MAANWSSPSLFEPSRARDLSEAHGGLDIMHLGDVLLKLVMDALEGDRGRCLCGSGALLRSGFVTCGWVCSNEGLSAAVAKAGRRFESGAGTSARATCGLEAVMNRPSRSSTSVEWPCRCGGMGHAISCPPAVKAYRSSLFSCRHSDHDSGFPPVFSCQSARSRRDRAVLSSLRFCIRMVEKRALSGVSRRGGCVIGIPGREESPLSPEQAVGSAGRWP